MDFIMTIVHNWKPILEAGAGVLIAVGGIIKAIETLIQLIAPLTKWTWDDNLATVLGKWAALKILNKKD